MGKPDQESAAAEEARRATGDAAGRGRGGRLSARRKRETVLRLLRGEDLESVSRELGITAARAAQWRDQFLAAGGGLPALAADAPECQPRTVRGLLGSRVVLPYRAVCTHLDAMGRVVADPGPPQIRTCGFCRIRLLDRWLRYAPSRTRWSRKPGDGHRHPQGLSGQFGYPVS